jgi:hypothetical protein
MKHSRQIGARFGWRGHGSTIACGSCRDLLTMDARLIHCSLLVWSACRSGYRDGLRVRSLLLLARKGYGRVSIGGD